MSTVVRAGVRKEKAPRGSEDRHPLHAIGGGWGGCLMELRPTDDFYPECLK